jgi:hypothetical protein
MKKEIRSFPRDDLDKAHAHLAPGSPPSWVDPSGPRGGAAEAPRLGCGREAAVGIRRDFSYRRAGLQYGERLDVIRKQPSPPV